MDRSATRRFEGLADGVFAIVITLLVLELRLPEAEGPHAALSNRLLAIWPSYVGYLVSFVFLGLWWLVHLSLLDLVRRMDGPLIWMNFLFLMLVTLIPFTARLSAENWDEPVAAVLYGLNLLLPLAVSRAFYFHIAGTPDVAAVRVDPGAATREGRGYLIVMLVQAVAIVLAFVNPVISFILYGLMAAFYIVVVWQGRVGLAAARAEQESTGATEKERA